MLHVHATQIHSQLKHHRRQKFAGTETNCSNYALYVIIGHELLERNSGISLWLTSYWKITYQTPLYQNEPVNHYFIHSAHETVSLVLFWQLQDTVGPVLIVWFNYCVLSFASEIANLLIVFASCKAREVHFK